jgi:voltage-gated sodium channel
MIALNRFVNSQTFHRFIIAVIVLAGVLAGLETSHTVVEHYRPVLRFLDGLVLTIFVGEAILKMATHGRYPWRYFTDPWNVFDFVILILCLVPVGGQFTSVLRLTRSLRLLRLVSALPKLQLLVGALLKSLGAMGYVGLFLTLLFYIYGVAGVHLFGKGDPAHFGSLGTALFTLFRVLTLDDWADIYHAQLAHLPTIKAIIYFSTFIMFGTMIILNLFIGIIMNGMTEMHDEIAEQAIVRGNKLGSSLTAEDEFLIMERRLEETQTELRRLRRRWNEAVRAAVKTATTNVRQLAA